MGNMMFFSIAAGVFCLCLFVGYLIFALIQKMVDGGRQSRQQQNDVRELFREDAFSDFNDNSRDLGAGYDP